MRTMEDWTPAEKAIWDAKQTVEAAGASSYLTKAVVLLGEVQELVAEHVEAEAEKVANGKKIFDAKRSLYDALGAVPIQTLTPSEKRLIEELGSLFRSPQRPPVSKNPGSSVA